MLSYLQTQKNNFLQPVKDFLAWREREKIDSLIKEYFDYCKKHKIKIEIVVKSKKEWEKTDLRGTCLLNKKVEIMVCRCSSECPVEQTVFDKDFLFFFGHEIAHYQQSKKAYFMRHFQNEIRAKHSIKVIMDNPHFSLDEKSFALTNAREALTESHYIYESDADRISLNKMKKRGIRFSREVRSKKVLETMSPYADFVHCLDQEIKKVHCAKIREYLTKGE